MIIPLALGLVRIVSQRLGVYEEDFAGWLFALLNLSCFTAAIWWIAAKLYHSDLRRQYAERHVRSMNQELNNAWRRGLPSWGRHRNYYAERKPDSGRSSTRRWMG